MELFLNLVWLLLAMPAYCLWRKARRGPNVEGHSSLQYLLALGCALVLLFPVVSATDDLHAMRAEMEESSKRGVRQAVSDKACTGQSRWHASPALAALVSVFVPSGCTYIELAVPKLFFAATLFNVRTGRAPPVFHLRFVSFLF
jgi:hypothetical protein